MTTQETNPMTPQPINTAPKDGGWILAHVPGGVIDRLYNPWRVLTWGDQGWEDYDGDTHTPLSWVSLPDPQPTNTGWRPATGHIVVSEITGEGWTSNGKPIVVPYRWCIWIERPDGSYDDYREGYHCVTREEAQTRALGWQMQHRLPIVIRLLDGSETPFSRASSL